MILSKDVKIDKINEFSGEYIESELKKQGYDVLRWAITEISDSQYTVSISYVID